MNTMYITTWFHRWLQNSIRKNSFDEQNKRDSFGKLVLETAVDKIDSSA